MQLIYYGLSTLEQYGLKAETTARPPEERCFAIQKRDF